MASLEKAIETRSSCSFWPNPVTHSSSSLSLVAQTAPWETRREIEAGYWEKKAMTLKRFHERSSTDDPCEQRAKRKKIYRGAQLAGAGVWFPSSGVEYLPLEEEQRAFSLPGGVEYLPPLPASSEPLVSSFRSDVPDKGDNVAGTSEGSKQKAKSDSSPSSSGERALRAPPVRSNLEIAGPSAPFPSPCPASTCRSPRPAPRRAPVPSPRRPNPPPLPCLCTGPPVPARPTDPNPNPFMAFNPDSGRIRILHYRIRVRI